jgi:hypothetical protein
MASTDTNSKEVIGVLNDLIETSKDGQEGFKECAEKVERSYLKTFEGTRQGVQNGRHRVADHCAASGWHAGG